MREFLGQNDMMAYLAMMAQRMAELHHLLKPTGSIYLHCDPTASHYLKLMMDAVFDQRNFRNEIIWRRTTSHSDAKGLGEFTTRFFYITEVLSLPGTIYSMNLTPMGAFSYRVPSLLQGEILHSILEITD